jgi:hypothetical protein
MMIRRKALIRPTWTTTLVLLVTLQNVSTAYPGLAESSSDSALRFQCVFYADGYENEIRYYRSDWLDSRAEALSQARDRCVEANRDAWMATCSFKSCRQASG